MVHIIPGGAHAQRRMGHHPAQEVIVIEASPHGMHLSQTYPSGAEEWLCPACGRRFVMEWTPAFKRIVLERGDEGIAHSGAKGLPGLSLSAGTLPPADATPSPEEETRLPDDLSRWLRDAGFEDWWGQGE